jgi:hypothetical protein
MAPSLHTRAVIGVMGDSFGLDEETSADLRRASRVAFGGGFADANDTRLTRAELKAPVPRTWWPGSGR